MPEQNLNPDALSSNPALFKVASTHHFHGNECLCGFVSPVSRQRTEHIMYETLSALPAQPELQENSKPNKNLEFDTVNSVEELEALPPCSVIVDKHGDAGLIEYGHVKFAETAKLPMAYVAKHYLPATVIYRPVEG